MKEVFKEIKDYEGLYEVSNLGNVRNCKTGRILAPGETESGYLYVNLSKNGEKKYYRVHRLVASAFIKNPANLQQVNHIDENKKNNEATNLEWCTASYNNNYGTRTERMAKSQGKKVICVETGEIYYSTREASRQTKINQGDICYCCLGKYHTAGGFHWKYVE